METNQDDLELEEIREIDYEFSPTGDLVLYVSEAILTNGDEQLQYQRTPPQQRLKVSKLDNNEKGDNDENQ